MRNLSWVRILFSSFILHGSIFAFGFGWVLFTSDIFPIHFILRKIKSVMHCISTGQCYLVWIWGLRFELGFLPFDIMLCLCYLNWIKMCFWCLILVFWCWGLTSGYIWWSLSEYIRMHYNSLLKAVTNREKLNLFTILDPWSLGNQIYNFENGRVCNCTC